MIAVLNKRTMSDAAVGVYVGRPSPWGNPWRAGHRVPVDYEARGLTHALTRHDAVACFRTYAERKLKTEPHWLDPLRSAEALICWCAPLECHADVLAELLER